MYRALQKRKKEGDPHVLTGARRPILPMPIRDTPYRHQIEAFNFVCALFGLVAGGERDGAGRKILLGTAFI